jgi:hypothetical protein
MKYSVQTVLRENDKMRTTLAYNLTFDSEAHKMKRKTISSYSSSQVTLMPVFKKQLDIPKLAGALIMLSTENRKNNYHHKDHKAT